MNQVHTLFQGLAACMLQILRHNIIIVIITIHVGSDMKMRLAGVMNSWGRQNLNTASLILSWTHCHASLNGTIMQLTLIIFLCSRLVNKSKQI